MAVKLKELDRRTPLAARTKWLGGIQHLEEPERTAHRKAAAYWLSVYFEARKRAARKKRKNYTSNRARCTSGRFMLGTGNNMALKAWQPEAIRIAYWLATLDQQTNRAEADGHEHAANHYIKVAAARVKTRNLLRMAS